jgi:hypothetical protein
LKQKPLLNGTGAGPLAVVNNRLEAASINSLIGGTYVQSGDDILDGYVFRGNHVWKDPNWLGQGYAMKNLWELKQGFNSVSVGNVFENNYAEGQSGEAILIKSMTDEGCHYCEVRNVDFRNNKVLNTRAGFNVINMQAFLAPYPKYANHIRFANNFWEQTYGRGNLSQGADYFELTHNTFVSLQGNSFFMAYSSGSTGVPETYKAPGFKLLNNIVYDATYQVALRCDHANGTGALTDHLIEGWDVRKNVMGGALEHLHPGGNFYPTSVNPEFVDYAGGNYNLKAGSMYKNAGTDGKDLGADWSVLNASTASAMSGLWGGAPTTPTRRRQLRQLRRRRLQQLRPTPRHTPTITPTPTPTVTPTPTPTKVIKGQVRKNGSGVSGVLVTLSGSSSAAAATEESLSGSSLATRRTDALGNYFFIVNAGGSYTVTPTKERKVSNTSSMDSTRIRQHLVKLRNLSANQLIASDVNNNGVVNSVDAARIQEHLVGIQSSNIIGEWKFSPAAFQYNSVTSDITSANYEAVVVGEVSANNTATAGFAETETSGDENGLWQTWTNLVSETTNLFGGKQQTAAMAEIPVSLPINATGGRGRPVQIPVTVGDLTGANVEAFDFSVFYNPGVLQPSSSIASSAGTLMQNNCTFMAHSPALGEIIVSGTCPSSPINSGSGTLINLNFDVIGSDGQQSQLSFTDPAVNQSMFQFNDATPLAKTTDGSFAVVGPTAAPVTVGGRVMTSSGRGILGARVSLTDSSGNTRVAVTNVFGYYRFADLTAGETYVLSVSAKRLKFASQTQVRIVVEDTSDINFISSR